MTELSDADRELVAAIIKPTGLEWDAEYNGVLETARRLITAEILAAPGQPHIARLAAENARMREALGWFLDDPRFVVTVGGNPIAVEVMLTGAAPHSEKKKTMTAEWQPIKTAPFNENILLGWWETWPKRVWKYEAGWAGRKTSYPRTGVSDGYVHGRATHWMPLPEPLK